MCFRDLNLGMKGNVLGGLGNRIVFDIEMLSCLGSICWGMNVFLGKMYVYY